MSRIKPISGFKTTDGKVFEDESIAQLHQSKINFCAWYEQDKNQLYGNTAGSRVDIHELIQWLGDNHEQVMAYMLNFAIEGPQA